MARLSITGKLPVSSAVGKVENDLDRISKAIRDDDFSTIEFPAPDILATSLGKVFELVPEMGKASDSRRLASLLRHYVFLIKRHKDKIYPVAVRVILAPLDSKMKEISDAIGEICVLNKTVELPGERFLPKEIKKTSKKWKKQPCENPNRGKSISENGIGFMCRDAKPAVRAWLEKKAGEHEIEHINVGTCRLYLNLIDFDYYKLGLMHADHLLPSASLIQRIKEMIEAMNYDSVFRAEMEESVFNDGYFIDNADGTVVGTYWLYMVYHNSVENLWFLLASDNSGSGKVGDDPVEWFKTTSIGRQYLIHLDDAKKIIDKSGILYTVLPDNISLKDSFVEWAKTTKRSLIKVCKSLSELHHELRTETLAVLEDSAGSGRRVRSTLERRLATNYVSAGFFGKKKASTKSADTTDSADDSSEVSSVVSEKREETIRIALELASKNSKLLQYERDARKERREVAREAKKRVAAKANLDSNVTNHSDADGTAPQFKRRYTRGFS